MIDCAILRRLLDTNTKKISEHLSSIGHEMLINNILFKWLLSLFIHTTSEEIMLCIWDLFLLEGHIVLFKSAIALLKIMEKDILSNESSDKLMNIFDTKCEGITCCKALRYYLLIKRYDFDIALINHNRELIFPKISNNIKNIPISRKNVERENNKLCNKLWPYCFKGKNEEFDIKGYFVYKTNKNVKIFKNYFFNVKKGRHNCIKKDEMIKMDIKRNSKSLEMKYTYNSKGSQNMKDIFNLLLIERRKHCCVNSIEEDDDNSNICARRNNSCVLFEQDFGKTVLNENNKVRINQESSSESRMANHNQTKKMFYY
jgi:hypothetical protein